MGLGWLRNVAWMALAAALPATATAAEPDLDRIEKLVVEKTNQFRHELGAGGVRPNAALEKAAHYFADYMARTDRYGHEADGATPAQRARRHGYDYCMVSENIAYQYSSLGFRTGELVSRYVEGWKDSPGHRRNMLDPAPQDIAVAVSHSPKTGRYYAVQMFGRPRSASVEFRLTNNARETARYRLDDREFALAPGAARVHTECVAPEVRLRVSAEKWGEPMRPAAGERLAIVREVGGSLALAR